MTVSVNQNGNTSGNGLSTNPGNKGRLLNSYLTDADGLRLASNTVITNIDVVNTCGEISTGSIAHCDVEATGCVV